jgi:hypothetical protein
LTLYRQRLDTEQKPSKMNEMAALLLLIAINIVTGYQNRFSRSYQSVPQSRSLDEESLFRKVTAGSTTSLFSLGDPDTDMESNFYRW